VLAQEGSVPVTVVPAPSFADQIIPIAVALATTIGIIMAAVLPAIAGIRKLIAEVKADQTKQGETVAKLEINTNSISEKLRQAIEAGALAAGNLAGRAELQAELDGKAKAVRDSHSNRPDDALPAGATIGPTKVEVVNPKPVKVTETKT
jgi:hypothetical protein